MSDTDGRYRFARLSAGRYAIAASLTGFKTARREVVLAAGQTLTVDLLLAVGALDETVVVTGAAQRVQTQSATVSTHRRGARDLSFEAPRQPWRHPSAPFKTTSFDRIDEEPFKNPNAEPLSTFSADVDTASYAYARRAILRGALPPKDAVRVEEFLNYFRYDYPNPSGSAPLSVTTEVGACPWHEGHLLAHIGLQARRTPRREVPPRNLVFLLDVSGSMAPDDKLPLVRTAMKMLVGHLTERDTVAVVVYAGSSGVALPPTRGSEHATIRAAIDSLQAGGSTNGAEGIQTAYRLAQEHFCEEGVNRVILATDGDCNTGMSSRGDLVRLIERKRRSGIFLTVLGVGDDNLKDGTMEDLADRGNGNYAYLDSLEEAQKVLVREANATLLTVAKDVKIQVEINPATVAAYRLIGYENRALAAEDFKDDRKDAGEVGSGHSVTALYEIVPMGAETDLPRGDGLRYQQPRSLSNAARHGELMLVSVRYKAPDGHVSQGFSVPVRAPGEMLRLTPNIGFSASVAAFAMLLRESPYRGKATWRMAAELGRQFRGDDEEGYRAQFVRLVEVADSLSTGARGLHR